MEAVTIDGQSCNKFGIETIDTNGLTNKFFVKGAKTNPSLCGTTMAAGKTYKVAIKVSEVGGGYSVDLFQVLGEVTN